MQQEAEIKAVRRFEHSAVTQCTQSKPFLFLCVLICSKILGFLVYVNYPHL